MSRGLPAAIAIGEIGDDDVEAVIDLWQRCDLTRPWNDPHADIALARRSPSSTILIARKAGEIVGTVLVGHDGHRGALYYLAVAPERRRQRLSEALVDAAKTWLRARGVQKLNLMIRPENHAVGAFYEALGFAREERIVYAVSLEQCDPR